MADTTILLSEGYRIRGDTTQWMLERFRPSVEKEDGTFTEENWLALGYYAHLVVGIRGYLDYRLRTCGATCPEELAACLKREAETVNAIDKLRVTVEALGIMP